MQLRQLRHRRSETGGIFPATRNEVRSFTELPSEVQSEILVRLPVKSLLFCKCVCQSLRALISNPNFVQFHLNRFNSPQNSLILHLDDEKHFLLYSTTRNPRNVLTQMVPQFLDPKYHQIFVVGSCNGLILFGARFGTEFEMDYVLILWNPVIGQHRFLPEPHFKYFSFHGFDFIPETNDYVVIKVSSIDKMIQVYKMSIDSWTSIDFSSSKPGMINTIHRDGDAVYCNGSFHWGEETVDNTDIFYYNLKDKELGVIKAPNYTIVRGYESSLIRKKVVVVDRCLAIIYWDSELTFPFEMWVMKDYGVEETWTLRFLIRGDIPDYVDRYLRGLWGSGAVIINEVGYHGRGRTLEYFNTLLSYDLNTRSMMNIARMEECVITGFCNYVETLVPVIKGD